MFILHHPVARLLRLLTYANKILAENNANDTVVSKYVCSAVTIDTGHILSRYGVCGND